MALIAITGWGQAEEFRRSLDAGFGRQMVKPTDPNALLRMLDRLQKQQTRWQRSTPREEPPMRDGAAGNSLTRVLLRLH
jgi:hypothetical protein